MNTVNCIMLRFSKHIFCVLSSLVSCLLRTIREVKLPSCVFIRLWLGVLTMGRIYYLHLGESLPRTVNFTSVSQLSLLQSLRWEKMARGIGVGNVLLSGQWGSDNILAFGLLVPVRAGFVQKSWELWGISDGPFPLPLPEAGGNFSLILFCENLIELLQVNFTKLLGGFPMIGPPWRFWLSDLSVLRFQQFVNPRSSLLRAPVPSGFCLWVSVVTPCTHLSLQPWGSGLPSVLSSPTDPRRVVDFSACLNFAFIRLEWWLPVSLYVELKTGVTISVLQART